MIHNVFCINLKNNDTMKQNQLTLLLCILIALFLNNVYMYSNDYSWTCSGSTTFSTTGSSLNGVTWIASVTGSSAGTGVSGEKCVQIAKNTSLTLTTSDFKGKNITKVTLQTWGSSGNSFTITNGSYTSTTTIHTSYSTSGATISFDNVGASTESLKFEWKSANKAFNVRQIKITYEESSTETTDYFNVSFVDNVQGTDCSSFDMTHVAENTQIVFKPISDKLQATTGTCEQTHYHFVGWIEDRETPNETGSNVIAAGTTSIKATKNVTYKAVWAQEAN